jgi:hypothetical protein
MALQSTIVSTIPSSIDYTNRDYYSLRDALVVRTQLNLPNWQGTDPNDFGLILLEAFAYVGDILNYYVDRAANENYIGTATQRQSLIEIAQEYGYQPYGWKAATTTLTFTNKSTTTAITIPLGTVAFGQVTYNDQIVDIYFTTTSDLTVPVAPSSSVVSTASVSATHGISVAYYNQTTTVGDVAGELLGYSDGTTSQQFKIDSDYVVEGSVQIYVQNGTNYELWSQISHLPDAYPTDPVYELVYDEDNYVHVTFGDGVSGVIPPQGSAIKVVYTIGGGAIGNVSVNVVNSRV